MAGKAARRVAAAEAREALSWLAGPEAERARVWARARERELRREAMRRAAVAGELAPGLG